MRILWTLLAILLLWYFFISLRPTYGIVAAGNARARKPTWEKMGSWWPYSLVGLGLHFHELYLWAEKGALELYDRRMQRDPKAADSAFSHERAHYYNPQGSSDTAWYGSCDKVAIASILFDEPRRDVYIDGVTFTVPMIKGLLAVIAEVCVEPRSTQVVGMRFRDTPAIVRLRDGTKLLDKIRNLDDLNMLVEARRIGRRFTKMGHALPVDHLSLEQKGTIPREEIVSVTAETALDVDPATFHRTIVRWIAKERRPLIIETDPRLQVWHFAYDRFTCNTSGKGVKNVQLQLEGGDQHIEYQYTIRCDWAGNALEPGTWVSKSPDYIWRVALNPDWMQLTMNPRNPYVLPRDVWAIYRLSI